MVSPYAVVEVSSGKSASRMFAKKKGQVSAAVIEKTFSPKRKAPPPPPAHARTGEGTSGCVKAQKHKPSADSPQCMKSDLECRRNTVRKIAPKKPPRTFSTFLEDTTRIPEGITQYGVCSSEPRGWVGVHLASLMADTVQCVYAKFLERVMRPDPLWELGWQHLSLLSSSIVAYKGVEMTIQVKH